MVGSTQTSVGDAAALEANPLLISKANEAVKSTWISVGAGKAHTVACDASGALYAWGFNMQGQLGQHESRKSCRLPTLVAMDGQGVADETATSNDDTLIGQVAAAGYYSVALSRTGRVYAFGQMAVAGSAQPQPLANAGTHARARGLQRRWLTRAHTHAHA